MDKVSELIYKLHRRWARRGESPLPPLPLTALVMGALTSLLCRTSMLLYGVSADLHDEYFSIIRMLISSHYMGNYSRDPIW